MDKEDFSVDKEELKNETKDTVNQVKDTIKNVDFKKDAMETKGFVQDMISNPIEAVKRAANEENILSKVIILIGLWVVLSVVSSFGFTTIKINILRIISDAVYPVVYILAPALVLLVLNKKNPKSLITNACTMAVASIPMILSCVISIITNIVSGISIITSPIQTTLSALSVILMYFGVKELTNEEDKECVTKFVIIKVIAALALAIVTRIG